MDAVLTRLKIITGRCKMTHFSDDIGDTQGLGCAELKEDDSYLTSHGKYILIVEDDYIVTEIISEALCKFFDCEVLTASSGIDAIDIFKAHADETCCIFLDYGIPDMHASRVLKQLRKMSLLPKVILSSGYPESMVLNDFPTELVDSFIAKPFSPLKLISVIRKLFEEAKPITYQICMLFCFFSFANKVISL